MNRLVLALLLACGCGPETIGDLPRPALVVIIGEPGGFCSSTYAVDANDVVWEESGCGESSGLIQQPSVAVDRRALDERMDRVLASTDDADCLAPGPAAHRYRFDRTLPGTDEWPSVRLCDPGVPIDALLLAEQMRLLATPQIDSGRGSLDGGRDL